MTLTSLPYAVVADPRAACSRTFFAAPHAFRVLRAWRAWAGRTRDSATSGFVLLRAPDRPNRADGTLVLAAEAADPAALNAIVLQSHQRPVAIAAPNGAGAMLADRATPKLRTTLRALDDLAIEVLLRTGAEVSRSLLVGLRHREGRFDLIAWPRVHARDVGADTRALLDAMSPWIER